jgi:hypothetical protein
VVNGIRHAGAFGECVHEPGKKADRAAMAAGYEFHGIP